MSILCQSHIRTRKNILILQGTSIQMQYHAKKKLRQNELLRRITPA